MERYLLGMQFQLTLPITWLIQYLNKPDSNARRLMEHGDRFVCAGFASCCHFMTMPMCIYQRNLLPDGVPKN